MINEIGPIIFEESVKNELTYSKLKNKSKEELIILLLDAQNLFVNQYYDREEVDSLQIENELLKNKIKRIKKIMRDL